MLCLKIVNTLLQNIVYILKQIVQGTQKWHWNFKSQACFFFFPFFFFLFIYFFKLWIKTVKILF